MTNMFIFYIFVFISIILVAGYFLGKKRNKQISTTALKTLEEIIKPGDQIITNIGGVVGYHVEMKFEEEQYFEDLRGTITLMPRHSLLYLPISKIFRKFDRFYLEIELKSSPVEREIHFLENKFLDQYRKGVKNNNRLITEEIQYQNKTFLYLYEKRSDLEKIKTLVRTIQGVKYIKEISLNPNGLLEILFIPAKDDRNKKILEPLIEWLQL